MSTGIYKDCQGQSGYFFISKQVPRGFREELILEPSLEGPTKFHQMDQWCNLFQPGTETKKQKPKPNKNLNKTQQHEQV